MARCETCGNEYDRAFEVRTADGVSYMFDSFECAIHALAPYCEHCHCRIIGHGVEAGEAMYCCSNCARQSGVLATEDHA